MDDSLKFKIVQLRNEGFSYNEISKQLNCSKAVISYHCTRNNVNDIGLRRKKLNEDEINEIKIFYKNHTQKETVLKFNISLSTIKKYVDKKMIILTPDERKIKNYEYVRNRRQKLKDKSIEYKGGHCEICGYNKCKWALDFHHKEKNNKEFTISEYLVLGWEKIKKELDKCICVCANCHRELHYQEYLRDISPLPDKE